MKALIAASQNLQKLFPFHFKLEYKQNHDEQALSENKIESLFPVWLIELNQCLKDNSSQLEQNTASFLRQLKKAPTFNTYGIQAATEAFKEAKAIIDEAAYSESWQIIDATRLNTLNGHLDQVNHHFSGLSSASRDTLFITGFFLLLAGMKLAAVGIIFTTETIAAGPILLGIGLSVLTIGAGILARLALRHDIDARPATKNISNMVGKLSDSKHALLFQQIKLQESKVDNGKTVEHPVSPSA